MHCACGVLVTQSPISIRPEVLVSLVCAVWFIRTAAYLNHPLNELSKLLSACTHRSNYYSIALSRELESPPTHSFASTEFLHLDVAKPAFSGIGTNNEIFLRQGDVAHTQNVIEIRDHHSQMIPSVSIPHSIHLIKPCVLLEATTSPLHCTHFPFLSHKLTITTKTP
jgi:hypothetical protein